MPSRVVRGSVGRTMQPADARGDHVLAPARRESGSGKQRCLLVADGFYEWTVGPDGKKQPIHFRLGGGSLFAFAGLWTCKTEESGERIESCTIVTTRPNELVAPVHDRMPVILPRELEADWLDPELPKEHALSPLESYPAGAMVAGPASTRANSVRNDDAGLPVVESLAA